MKTIAETMPLTDELEFCILILRDIDEWLSSRPLPEGHVRFFHGTSTKAMNNIPEYNIDQVNFHKIGDFGPAFYCADTVRTALRFAIMSALEEGYGRRSASLVYFDVTNEDLDELTQTELEGDEWTEFTGHCLREKYQIAYAGERSDLQLVKGKLVRKSHEVEHEGVPPEEFEDNRKQYAFRKDAGNLLIANRGKMGVALFDVYMPDHVDDERDQYVKCSNCI
jgi:hypothetical protein